MNLLQRVRRVDHREEKHLVDLATACCVLVYTLPTVSGWLYFAPVALATLDLIVRNAGLLVEPTAKRAFALFKVSYLYLALVLLMICVDAVWACEFVGFMVHWCLDW